MILVDNLRNGYLENLKIDNQNYGTFYNLDINSDGFHELVEASKPDVIIHLAAITSLPDCELNYRECIRVNVEGTASVLGAASKYGVKRVIFSSTSAVYENTKFSNEGFKESDDINPRLFYSLSKKMSEEICHSFIENYGLDVIILRLFNVFGPRQDIHRKSPPIINYIVREFLEERSPILHSSGEQKRDYIFIDDVIEVIEKFIDTDKKYGSTVFNVSSFTQTSVKEIVYSIKESNDKFQKIKETYRDPDKLWDSYPNLFSGKFFLKREVVQKETLKQSLGNNGLLREEFNWSPDKEIRSLITKTSRNIQNK
jgi:nucleoside-diphosphate-sugar epimerase